MSCGCEIQAGVVGLVLTLACVDCDGTEVDVSAGSDFHLIMRPPRGPKVTVDAELGTSNHHISYTTVSGDFATPGTWLVQGEVTLLTGTFKTAVVPINVAMNL